MRRSTRESDEDLEAKAGRKARPQQTVQSVVDSPLRRSRRIRNPLKTNDSSPDSPVSDSSNISNAQVARPTRKRTGTMDSALDSQRALRSRKNSVSSDVSELAEVDLTHDTPSKRNTRRSLAAVTSGDTPKLNSRTSKRLTRAGSEAKSTPPMARTTRRTRASSMEPESVAEIKVKEETQGKTTGTPIKTRRRASVLPSESTVQEEGEEHIPCIDIDETLSEVDESLEKKDESKESILRKSLGSLKHKTQDESNRDQTNLVEDYDHVNGPRDVIAKSHQSDTHENINDSVSLNDTPNDKTTVGKNDESNDESAVRENKPTAINVEQSSLQSSMLDSSKELGLEIESLLNVSMKKQGNSSSNKENITSNIIGDVALMKDMESINACVVVLSTKCPLPTKSLKDKYKSLVDEPILKTDQSTESDNTETNEKSSDITLNVTEDSENSTLTKDVEMSDKEKSLHDSQNNGQNSVSDVEPNTLDKSCDKDLPPEKDLTLDSIDSRVELSTENAESVKETESNESTMKISNKDPDDDVKMDVDISVTDSIQQQNENQKKREETESTNKATGESLDTATNKTPDESSEKKSEDTSTTVEAEHVAPAVHEELQSNVADRSAAEEKEESMEQSGEKLDSSKEITDNTETTEKPVSPKTSDVSMSEAVNEDGTADVKKNNDQALTAINNESSITLDREATDDCTTIEPKSTEALLNLDDSLAAMTEDQNDGVVKNSQSYIVTETADVPTEDMPNKEEPSALEISGAKDRSLNKSMNKSKRAADGEKLEEEDKDKGGGDKMELGDSDTEANIGNLFQNISADEWKQEGARKKADSENDSVHSLSTEKLENESEAECDLVLVDRDAWLAAENARAAKEKDNFDYDSDDTVVLKSRTDFIRHKGKKESSIKCIEEESEMMVDDDDVKPTGREKTPKGKNSGSKEDKVRKEDEETTEDVSNTSVNKSKDAPVVKETKRASLVDPNASRKSNVSLNESQKAKEGQRRKSLNVSTADVDMENSNVDVENTVKSKNENQSQSKIENEEDRSKSDSIDGETKKRKKSLDKSLNKSRSKNEEESNELSESHPLSASCKKNVKNRTFETSLNISKSKKTPVKSTESPKVLSSDKEARLGSTSSEDSGDQNEASKTSKAGSGKKKRFDSNYSTLVHVGTDSEENVDYDSNDSQDGSLKIPNFLFADASSDDEDDAAKFSENSIDSDIAREYNLEGKTVSKFADDDIPGDECRASESEFSDPDDNGSDLADFVVYDEEVEEEWSGENEEEDENDEEVENEEEDENENEVENDEEVENENEEDVNVDGTADESEDDEKDANEEENVVEGDNDVEEEVEMNEVGKRKRSKNKSKDSILSESTGSAKLKQKSKTSYVELEDKPSLNSSKKSKQRNSTEGESTEQQLNMSDMLFIGKAKKLNVSMECSTPKTTAFKRKTFEMSDTTLDTTSGKSTAKSSKPLNENNLEESRKSAKGKNNEKSLLGKSLPTDLKGLVERSNLSKPICPRNSEFNKTAIVTGSDTPRTKFLRKEKLNESAPALKLGKDSEKLMKSFSQQRLSQSANAELMAEDEEQADNDDNEEARSMEKEPSKLSKLDSSDEENIQENVPRKAAKKSKKKQEVSFQIITDQSEEHSEVTSEPDDKKKKKKQKKKNTIAKQEAERIDDTRKSLETDKSAEDETSEAKKRKKRKNKEKRVNDAEDAEIGTKKRKIEDTIDEQPLAKKRNKKAEVAAQKPKASKPRQVEEVQSDSNEAPETLTFARARGEALEAIKRVKESIRASKETKKQKRVERLQTMQEEKSVKFERKKRVEEKRVVPETIRKGVKRLSEEVIENLSDVPIRKRPKKLPKQQQHAMPSRSILNSGFTESKIGNIDDPFISLSSTGGTTQFSVVNLQKLRKHSKKAAAVAFFRQRMLSRNGRQPVSAYLMYLQKQKAAGRDKF